MRVDTKRLLPVAVIALCIAVAFLAWEWFKPNGLPDGIASGNGRIEAVEIDIATKTPGRVKDILANEGDFVRTGQILAVMDTAVLEAQRREAEAQLQRAVISVEQREAW